MEEKVYYYVGWNHVLAIWWEQLWRVALVNIILYALANASLFLTPVVYNTFREMFKYQDAMSAEFWIALEMAILLWAGRESLVDRYSRFTLVAENKATKRTIYAPNKRLPWSFYLTIWWSQIWRMLLVPGAVIGGSLLALIIQHPNAANYTHMLHPAVINLSIYATIVLSLWAMRECLADRYRTFRLVTEPKTFYGDGTNT